MNKLYRLLRYDWPLHFVLVFTNWLPDSTVIMKMRGKLSSLFLIRCGKNLMLGRDVTIYNPTKLTIGNNCYLAKGVWISCGEEIVFEDEIMVSCYSTFSSSTHTRKNGSYRFGDNVHKKIKIGRGTWIGTHCSFVYGTTVGRGCIIGTGTVVTKDVPDNVLFAGVPGRVIKELKDE